MVEGPIRNDILGMHHKRQHMGIYAHPIKVIGSQRYRDLDELVTEARSNLECPQSAPSAGDVH